ncbi:MAG TPA: septal ring lytic transglycosylase RlpA family protein [Anaeromyxobacteraceae bacterium]|nr:septal ring lytic transglycosylase RlpA family protein [Anaeromyxobacteraceae bacterium]
MLARALLTALAFALACARVPTRAADAPEEGEAAFYADRFEGRRTASGEPYDARQLTCAHRTHPFGAILEVTDVATGRSVRVRVNDRGPWTRGRIVDLSKAAARALGILERGTARVRIVRVE